MAKPHGVGHVLQAEGADPARDRVVLEINGVRMIIVAVPDPNQAAATAVELIEVEHVASIELDGGLGVTGASQVIEAIEGAVPVGPSCSGLSHSPTQPLSSIDMTPSFHSTGEGHHQSADGNVVEFRFQTTSGGKTAAK